MKQHNALIVAGAAGSLFGGAHVVDDAEAAAGTTSFSVGVQRIDAPAVQILRAGAMVTNDVQISMSGGVLTISNGIAYELQAGDVINFFGVGA